MKTASKHWHDRIILAASVLTLAACGGGGSGADISSSSQNAGTSKLVAAETVSGAGTVTNTPELDHWRDQLNACFALPMDERVGWYLGTVNTLKNECARMTVYADAYKSNGYGLLQSLALLLTDNGMNRARFGRPIVLAYLDEGEGTLAMVRIPYFREDGDFGHITEVARKTGSGDRIEWSIVGNQQDYDAGVSGRMDRIVDMRTGRVSYRSSLRLAFNAQGPNAALVNIVRVTGPGLPEAGVVLGKSNACGTATYLPIQNKTGSLNITVNNMRSAGAFILGAAHADGSAYAWAGGNAHWAAQPATDYSIFRPGAAYRFELYRDSAAQVGDITVHATSAPVMPSAGAAMQWNELTAAAKEWLNPASAAKAGATASMDIGWVRNRAAPSVQDAAGWGSSVAMTVDVLSPPLKPNEASTTVVANAVGSGFDPNACGTATFPALNQSGNGREIALRGINQDGIRQYSKWVYQN